MHRVYTDHRLVRGARKKDLVCMATKASKKQMMMINALKDQSIVDDFQPMLAEVDAEFQPRARPTLARSATRP